MSTPDNLIRQPFGAMKDFDKIITSLPADEPLEETRSLTIIYAKRKLEVDIPVHWTINKVKCMLLTHFDILNFDKFEFQCNKMLIPGKTLVANLPDHELIVTQADCPKAFEKYYKETMKQVTSKYNINTSSTIYPITHQAFSSVISQSLPKERQNNIAQLPVNRNRRGGDDQQQGVIVINIFRVIGIAILTNIIFSFASYWQIGILFLIACIYYLIDEHVKENDRRRREAERVAQRQQEANRRLEELKRVREDLVRQRQQAIRQRQQFVRQRQQAIQQKKKAIDQFVKNKARLFEGVDQRVRNHPQIIETEKEIQKFLQENQFLGTNSLEEKPEIRFNESTSPKIESYMKSKNQTEKEQPILLNQSSNNEKQQKIQQPQRHAFRGQIKLWTAFIVEAIYCYILSIFPNWTVETHLHANQQIMDNLMDEVKRLDPEASEQVKKWEIKEQKPSQINLFKEKEQKPKEE